MMGQLMLTLLLVIASVLGIFAAQRPNIVVIVADDLVC